MERKHDLGEFGVRYDLDTPYGVTYSICKRGDTYDEDGGRNRHSWHWEVRCKEMLMASDYGTWTDKLGMRHDGFPSAELAYEDMAMCTATPEEYRDVYDQRCERASKLGVDGMLRNLGRAARCSY